MNHKFIKYTFVTLSTILLLTAFGCNDAEYSSLNNKLFIAETGSSSNVYKKITIDEAGAEVAATGQISNPAQEDINIKFVVDTAALRKYNERNSTNYVVLPKSNYALEQTEVTIKKGESIAPAINIALKALTKEMVETGNKYALPIRIKPLNMSQASVLEGANTIIYVLDQVIITSVPILGTDKESGYHAVVANLKEDIVLSEWTVEMRVNMSAFRRNNQALFGVWGPNSEIYMRFGDANTPFNTLQVKFAGSQFDRSIKEFDPNTWYHIAVTYTGSVLTLYINGVEDVKTDKWGGKTTTMHEKIHIANSSPTWFVDACMMSEVRLWNVARSQSEIVNNQYTINPKSKGLLMYWKMNENKGDILKNSVEGAPDLEATNPGLRWLDNVRSDGKGRTKIYN